jgi:hypothetical protein
MKDEANPQPLESTFRALYEGLCALDYHWEPRTPDELLRLRKDPGNLGPLERCFGLGLEVEAAELEAECVADDPFRRLPALP